MNKILIIQTAFIGDAVLATGIAEKLRHVYPNAAIDFMVRKGNESLFNNHPFIKNVLVWNKQQHKYKSLWRILQQVRCNKYDVVVNVQRFAATGLFTVLSKAKITIGFNKNPLSFLFTTKVKHIVSTTANQLHEVQRNQMLIESIAGGAAAMPKLYPSTTDEQSIATYTHQPYICIAPASVWFTKQYPKHKWIELANELSNKKIYLLGAKSDAAICDEIINGSKNNNLESLAGKLNFLQSAALMKKAVMNFVNDSAPMHFASAVNAPVTAVYCSTLPAFGFGPLSNKSFVVEETTNLPCRPCGLHGKKVCPQGHFNCANNIKVQQLLSCLHV